MYNYSNCFPSLARFVACHEMYCMVLRKWLATLHTCSNNIELIVGDEVEDLVVDMRNETGKVIFKAPEEGVNVCSHHSVDQLTVTICTSHCLHVGAEFMLYTYCYTNGKVAFLMCVALNGFHTKATHRWYKDAQLLEDENNPIHLVGFTPVWL